MKIKKVIKMLIKQGPFAVLRAIRDHYRKKREEEKFRNRVRSLHLISDDEFRFMMNFLTSREQELRDLRHKVKSKD